MFDIKERVEKRIVSLGKQIEKDEGTIKLAESLGMGEDGVIVDLKFKNNVLRRHRATLEDMLRETYGSEDDQS